jgi:hypothetical protein
MWRPERPRTWPIHIPSLAISSRIRRFRGLRGILELTEKHLQEESVVNVIFIY